jgi:hypothetical protein
MKRDILFLCMIEMNYENIEMKKNNILKGGIMLSFMFAAQIGFAQNTFPFPESGRVGIGTATPTVLLQAQSVVDTFVAHFSGNNLSNGVAIGTSAENTGIIQGYSKTFSTTSNIALQPYSGNLGVGVVNPSQKLEVGGSGLFNGRVISTISGDIGGEIVINNPSKTANGTAKSWSIFNMTGGYGNSLQFWAYDNLGCAAGGLCTNRFTIMDNGNVGIGVLNPNNKLDVKGTIHSQEVKVDMLDWSDFVFKKGYNLPTLEEVEKHIAEKGHLENIPSEEEVLKNGIVLGEMNAKLLQKIEELTLYMIEMKKENERVKGENILMKKNQTELEKRIIKLERK